MIVSLTVTTVLVIISGLLIRGRRVGLPTAITLWLCGFTLAHTAIAGPVDTAISAVVGLISHH